MDREALFEFVSEALDDEQKVVTYKWLSISTSISMNDAKRCLQEFLNSGKRSGLTVCLCMTGYKNVDGVKVLNVKIIKEEEKEAAEKECPGASFHVYSIQRLSIFDPCLLYSIDYDTCKQLSFDKRHLLGIKCEHITVRTFRKVTKMVIESDTNLTKTLIQPESSSTTTKSCETFSIFSKKSTQKANRNSASNSQNSDTGPTGANKKNNIVNFFKNQEKTNVAECKVSEKDKIDTESELCKQNVKKKQDVGVKPALVQKGKRKRVIESSSSGSSEGDDSDASVDLFESSFASSQNHLTSKQASEDDVEERAQASSRVRTTNADSSAVDNKEAKENENTNCRVNVKKVLKTNNYLTDDGFLLTVKVQESVEVPVEEMQKVDLEQEKEIPEAKPKVPVKNLVVPKKVQAPKKKAVGNTAKQSTISTFFAPK